MAIRVECDQCYHTHNVPDEREGQPFKCRSCGHRLIAQAALPPKKLPPRSGRPTAVKNAKAATGGGSGKLFLIIGGLAAVAVIGIVAFVAVRMMGKGGDESTVAGASVADNSLTPAVIANPAAVAHSATAPAPVDPVGMPMNPAAAMPPITGSTQMPTTVAPLVTSPVPAFSPSTKVAWSATVDPSRNPIEWPAKPKWNYNFEGDQDGLLYPATPSSFLLAGIYVSNVEKANVVDLLTNKVVGGFPTKIAGHGERALSPDGRYLAVSLHQPRGTVEIWTPQSPQPVKVMQLTTNAEDIIIHMAFRSPTELVVAGFVHVDGKIRKQLRVVNAETGQTISQLITEKDLDFKNNSLSPGGRYLYSLNLSNTLTTFDLDLGTCVGEVSLKKTSENGNSLSSGGAMHSSITPTDDGTQICLLQTSQWETVLVFIDAATGAESEQIMLPGKLQSIADNDVLYHGQKIQFMKGGKYILLDGQLLVDRQSKRVVWLMAVLPSDDQYQFTNNAERRVAGDFLIISDGPRNFPELRAQSIPFDKIETALAVVESGGAATLSPKNGEVSLDIDVASVRFGDVAQTKKELGSTLTDRLTAEGLTVTPAASAVLKLQYAEGAGNTLSQSTFRPGTPRSQQPQTPAGPSLESTKAMMQLSLSIDKKEVWAKVIELDPRVLFVQGNATAETARASVFEHVQQALYGIPVVWYVSAEKPYSTLPMLESLKSESISLGGRRPSKRPGSR